MIWRFDVEKEVCDIPPVELFQATVIPNKLPIKSAYSEKPGFW
jgi:hypothetical protein